ncbi:hypothetical protein G6553_10615 [Nocardioides sp. IC4_145]|uniref:hypothetical protein n=1 Tax=Nocardioides sp. IC4_145 TaxID=2714037 RepID=UPI001407BECA|nr:hypothetical protein [Nocardioides sp. IC4_145]NHC23619.1 hypothetical protein [Nocardioides sp. IC4_145]
MKKPVDGLDDHITDAFSVVSLLIAIVAAYLAAIWPVVTELLNRPRPDVAADRRQLAQRCSAYRWIAWGLTLAGGAVAAIMLPLVADVVNAIDTSEAFSTLRASVLVFFILLVGAVVTAGVIASRLGKRASKLR